MAYHGYNVGLYDPSDRARQKQVARERDDMRLQNGDVSRDALRQEVSFFSALDLSRSKIVRRRVRIEHRATS
jgi:hypothetical protein